MENITLTKDINGIVKYITSEQEKVDQNLNNIPASNIISIDSSKRVLETHNVVTTPQNNINVETSSNVNVNLDKTKKDFSSLLILMRKATRLINVFDNKVKLVANKLNE